MVNVFNNENNGGYDNYDIRESNTQIVPLFQLKRGSSPKGCDACIPMSIQKIFCHSAESRPVL